MPWNREKIRVELDRPTLVKGVETAVYENGELALENILELLESGDATENQIKNTMALLNELLLKESISSDPNRIFNAMISFLDHNNKEVVNVVSRNLVLFSMKRCAYVNLKNFKYKATAILELIGQKAPDVLEEMDSQVKYIKELESDV